MNLYRKIWLNSIPVPKKNSQEKNRNKGELPQLDREYLSKT